MTAEKEHDDAVNESTETNEDLQTTLETAMALRKNLDVVEFRKVQAPAPPPPAAAISASAPVVAVDEKSHFSVYLRIRPSPDTTMELLSSTKVRTTPPTSSQVFKSSREIAIKDFDFTHIFDDSASQMAVYHQTAAPLVQGLLQNNKSGLLFCYGITNAGKTHTVLGEERKVENWGIVPRAMQAIVEQSAQECKLSYLEVYNEQVFDLLAKPGKPWESREALKIGDVGGSVVVRNLSSHTISDVTHGLELIQTARRNRQTATNRINTNSSRSHCICQLTVGTESLWIVDLAGSERSKRTQGTRPKEAALINKSLMTLMRCLMAMREESTEIPPYRDSKLTHLFMNHLMSSGKTCMIVNVCPSVADFDETQHVLAYAASAKSVQYVPKPKVKSKVGQLLKKLSPKRKTTTTAASLPVAKRLKPAPEGDAPSTKPSTAVDVKSSKEYKSLKMELSVVRAEKEMLQSERDELLERLQTLEDEVRTECVQEMETQMNVMRSQYADIIDGLKKSKMPPSVKKPQRVEELKEKMEEYEAELHRLQQQHQAEMTLVRQEYEEELRAKDKELKALKSEDESSRVTSLKAQLDAANVQIKQLQQSKKELLESFALLEKEEESDAEDEEEEEEEEDGDISSEEEADSDGEQTTAQKKSRESELPETEQKAELEEDAGMEADLNDDVASEMEDEEQSPQNDDDFEEDSGDEERKTTAKKDSSSEEEDDSEEESDDEERRQTAENEVQMSTSSRRMTRTASSKTTQSSLASRAPLGSVPENVGTEDSDDSFGPAQWLYPKKAVKKDPATGTYQRPRGRKPANAEAWDEQKGAWRLSMA